MNSANKLPSGSIDSGIGQHWDQLTELRMELISAHGAVDTALVEYLPGIMVPISEFGAQ